MTDKTRTWDLDKEAGAFLEQGQPGDRVSWKQEPASAGFPEQFAQGMGELLKPAAPSVNPWGRVLNPQPAAPGPIADLKECEQRLHEQWSMRQTLILRLESAESKLADEKRRADAAEFSLRVARWDLRFERARVERRQETIDELRAQLDAANTQLAAVTEWANRGDYSKGARLDRILALLSPPSPSAVPGEEP